MGRAIPVTEVVHAAAPHLFNLSHIWRGSAQPAGHAAPFRVGQATSPVICLMPLSETTMSSTIDTNSRLSPMHGSNERRAIPVVGLIGGIGSGKSYVAGLLSKRGAVVIDADAVGHEVLEEPEIRRQ